MGATDTAETQAAIGVDVKRALTSATDIQVITSDGTPYLPDRFFCDILNVPVDIGSKIFIVFPEKICDKHSKINFRRHDTP